MTEKKPWKGIIAYVDPNYVSTVGLGPTIQDVAGKHDVEVRIFQSFSELTADDYVKMVLLVTDSRSSGANGSEFFGKFVKSSEQYPGLQLAQGMTNQHPDFPIIVLDKYGEITTKKTSGNVHVVNNIADENFELISRILEEKLREPSSLAEKRNTAAGQFIKPDSASR